MFSMLFELVSGADADADVVDSINVKRWCNAAFVVEVGLQLELEFQLELELHAVWASIKAPQAAATKVRAWHEQLEFD